MADILDFINQRDVPAFFRREQEKVTRYLVKYYGVGMEQAQEAFQEGCLAMFYKIHDGSLTKEGLRYSLSSYLRTCCINQLLKSFQVERRKGNEVCVDDTSALHSELKNMLYNDGLTDREARQRGSDKQLMEDIVRSMPHPCCDLIFGRYYGKESMDEMAAMYGLKSAGAAKTALHRCIRRLSLKFNSLRQLSIE